ncbi:MAG: hypothetical protein F6K03_15910, partial [Kamptonema sp. SIO4C4]|nr:hypothetical protein [Kamptonema sp. SIO4C4]
MENQFEPLEGGEVLFVENSAQVLIGHNTFRVSEITEALKQYARSQGKETETLDDWLSPDGLTCEVLRFGAQGWQRGKVRISVEFAPSEPRPQPHAEPTSTAPPAPKNPAPPPPPPEPKLEEEVAPAA